jgi:SAM-dependent methyltransferase
MVHELYQATGLPVLQNRTFPDADSARASASGDMRLVQDLRTGLVHNQTFDARLLSYDSDYQNEQALSAAFQRHLDQVEQRIARHFTGQRMIEVGCGKGYFLELLRARGHVVTGIDPAYEGDNPQVIKAPFTRELGLSGDAIILRHVLEHIEEPLAFLATIADANQGGLIYIEVPCLDWILAHHAWFDLFYEHVNYFRLCDLLGMFSTVLEAGHLFAGQYLYIVADLASLRAPAFDGRPVRLPVGFDASLERGLVLSRERAGQGMAIWGASSKGVIYGLSLLRAGGQVDQVIDINPAKQGRYLPLSGLCVSSPNQALEALPEGAHILVMNSNYLDEIRRDTGNRFVYHAVDDAAFR